MSKFITYSKCYMNFYMLHVCLWTKQQSTSKSKYINVEMITYKPLILSYLLSTQQENNYNGRYEYKEKVKAHK